MNTSFKDHLLNIDSNISRFVEHVFKLYIYTNYQDISYGTFRISPNVSVAYGSLKLFFQDFKTVSLLNTSFSEEVFVADN